MNNYQHSRRPNGSSSKPAPASFSECGDKVKKELFQQLYDDILNMKQTAQADKLLEATESFVKEYGKDVSTTQIRNIYDKVKKTGGILDLKMIRPQLAYIAGRDKNDNSKAFLSFLDGLIKHVNTDEQHQSFVAFFEATVAYHKYYGKNN